MSDDLNPRYTQLEESLNALVTPYRGKARVYADKYVDSIHVTASAQQDCNTFYFHAWHLPEDRLMRVESIAANGPFRGSGLGRATLREAFNHFAGPDLSLVHEIDLTACRANGVSFWSRAGFYPMTRGEWRQIASELAFGLRKSKKHFLKDDAEMLRTYLRAPVPAALCDLSNTTIRGKNGVPAQKLIGLWENASLAFKAELRHTDPTFTRYFLPFLKP